MLKAGLSTGRRPPGDGKHALQIPGVVSPCYRSGLTTCRTPGGAQTSCISGHSSAPETSGFRPKRATLSMLVTPCMTLRLTTRSFLVFLFLTLHYYIFLFWSFTGTNSPSWNIFSDCRIHVHLLVQTPLHGTFSRLTYSRSQCDHLYLRHPPI